METAPPNPQKKFLPGVIGFLKQVGKLFVGKKNHTYLTQRYAHELYFQIQTHPSSQQKER